MNLLFLSHLQELASSSGNNYKFLFFSLYRYTTSVGILLHTPSCEHHPKEKIGLTKFVLANWLLSSKSPDT